ncbi:MAG: hypothetical protein FWE94_05650 [Coriobacteriia bacterium]|nr:hypothetical protein [Coriobacteriia bacterium]
MGDIFYMAAEAADIPEKLRDEIVMETKIDLEDEILNALSERMHNRAVSGSLMLLATFGDKTTVLI